MKVRRRVVKTEEVEIKWVEMVLPFDADDEIPEWFPGRDQNAGTLTFRIDLDTAKVVGWPGDESYDLYIKVRDEGIYRLLGPNGEDGTPDFFMEWQDYVPDYLPNNHGDYVDLRIATDGTVTNYRDGQWGDEVTNALSDVPED